VRDGETGRLFAAGDARALAATIAELATDRAQAQRVGAAAAADVRARFGLQRMLDGVHEAYGHLLAARA
jgi:glycosyltransferase involved in cell wall biosynthesis